MENATLLQGRWWTPEQIELIRQLIAAHPAWSRRRISVALSEAFAWRTATGQLRDMAARHLLARSAAQRRARLWAVVNNTRLLILPHVRAPHLASHVLGRLRRRLPADWQAKYAQTPVLAETFVERDRLAGICCQAANWQCVGQSCGRSRGDRAHRLQVPIKEIYLYPLRTDFRRLLGAD